MRITEVLEGKEVTDLHAVYDEKRLFAILEHLGLTHPIPARNYPPMKRTPINSTIIPYYKVVSFCRNVNMRLEESASMPSFKSTWLAFNSNPDHRLLPTSQPNCRKFLKR